jgi:ATP-dependent Clp protease, protease subunit
MNHFLLPNKGDIVMPYEIRDAISRKNVSFDQFFLEHGIISLHGDICRGDGEEVRDKLYYLQKQGIKTITLDISSYGGSVHGGLDIYDSIRQFEENEGIVITHCHGVAMSMAAILLSSGTKGYRYATKNSRIMIHQVSCGAIGSISDVKIQTKESEKLNDIALQLLAQNTNKSVKQIKKDIDRDHFMSAEEALKYGLIDKVV